MEPQQQQSPSSSTTTLVPNEAGAAVGMPPALKILNSVNLNSPRLVNGPDMPQLAPGLAPQPVGREFVRQYYTVMSKSPQMLHRFYAANSTLTYCNGPPIFGQDDIRKDIEMRCLRDCHTRIFKIDAQPTLANGVVVQVVGELSNNNEPLRSFTQTFVLTPLMPKNFFVYNEIFRYQDDMQSDVNMETLKLDHAIGAVTAYMAASDELWLPSNTLRALNPVLTRQVIAISKSIASIAIQTANETVLNGKSERVTVPPALHEVVLGQPLKTAAETQTSTEQQLDSVTQTSMATATEENAVDEEPKEETTQTSELEKELNATIQQEPCTAQPTQSTPMLTPLPTPLAVASAAAPPLTLVTPVLTYANVFKSSSTQSLNIQMPMQPAECELQSEISTTYIPSATFTTTTSGNSSPAPNAERCLAAASPIPDTQFPTMPESSSITSLPIASVHPTPSQSNQSEQRQNRYDNVRNRYEPNAGRNMRSNNPTYNSSGGSSAYNTQRRPRPQYERYDDHLQLFLGNLPMTATVEELTQMFERYGSILDLRVLSKSTQPGQRKVPNYGFLTYATTEAVERCLSDLPFYYPENSDKSVRLNVRPKNEAAIAALTQQQQQQQPTRAGKYNFRFDSGGDQIRSTDQSRYRRLFKRDSQEQQNGSGEASNVVAPNTRSLPYTAPTIKDDWPELSAASSKGNKK